MQYLIAVTVLWAFSFSLIGVYLAGQVDAWFSVLIRVFLAMCVFLPFLRFKHLSRQLALKLMSLGAVQLGVMYGFYYHSFLYLSVPEVLLFTVMTPVYITLINDLLAKQFNVHYLLVAAIAVIGAITIRYESINEHYFIGFMLVQGANLCFALGQVGYKRLMQTNSLAQSTVFGCFFIGAFIVALFSFMLFGNTNKLPSTMTQWLVLTHLGLVASGLGYFAWNKGATLVDVGTLAIMNNVLIPTGIIVNLLIWNRDADMVRLAVGGVIMLFALWLNHRIGAVLKKSESR